MIVEADDSVTTAERSVSLGLLLTELVINSLKHAFPGDGSLICRSIRPCRPWACPAARPPG